MPEYLTFANLPTDFQEQTGYALADYSLAIGRVTQEKPLRFKVFGSGVLVRRGNRFGVLTAHHCLNSAGGPDFRFGSIDGDKLMLVLKRVNCAVLPPEILVQHNLGIPSTVGGEPDLAFVEILNSPELGSLKAVSSFWSLDRNAWTIKREFGQLEMPFAVIGFPGEFHRTIPEGNVIRKIYKHMAFFYGIRSDGIFLGQDWDYLEAVNRYDSSSGLPSSFNGVSGGPAWGLQIQRDKSTGQLVLKDHCLIGIAISQIRISNEELRVRIHFIRSIYNAGWQGQTQ